jgi:hypothetical protein
MTQPALLHTDPTKMIQACEFVRNLAMTRIAAVFFSILFLAGPASAQTQNAPAGPPAVAPPGRIDISPEQRARIRAAREECIREVKPQSLPRRERRSAMRACLEAKNPELAPIFSRGEARRAEMRQLRQACRDELRGRRLARDERRQAMQSCLVRKRPELAKVFSCRDEALKRNLGPGPERRDFMRSCVRG